MTETIFGLLLLQFKFNIFFILINCRSAKLTGEFAHRKQIRSEQKTSRVKSMFVAGPFVQMIYRMIAGDMIRFGIIAAIFLVSFSQGEKSMLSKVVSKFLHLASFLLCRQRHGLKTAAPDRRRGSLQHRKLSNLHLQLVCRNFCHAVSREYGRLRLRRVWLHKLRAANKNALRWVRVLAFLYYERRFQSCSCS